ncbi:pilus assembly protein [Mesorhizobium sp. L-8-10]|uniref:Flp family type IVb pilin n=1 Tax=unclassified Mesorhizobium TaxID=325217 RepID=UPI0019262A02|nr:MULTISPECIES: Flp family type IVb pilin [unclassified Mesorhizobium]BCH22747.1 pilus assembly protein [Mesorhizobium sp. L-8-3]BCH30551.1 pilus assembly protein [Mesorhizobium sp. L-8-10]
MIRRFLNDETGATVVEYALIAVVLSLMIVAGVGRAAEGLTFLFADNNSRLANAFK